MSFEVGARVVTDKNKTGTVSFCGPTQFSDGEWVGVALDEPAGKNNGSVKGVRYFECDDNHGIFVRALQLKLEAEKGKSRLPMASGLKTPASISRPAPVSKLSPAPSKERLSSQAKLSPSQSKEQLAGKQKAKATPSTGRLKQSSSRESFKASQESLSQDKRDSPKPPGKTRIKDLNQRCPYVSEKDSPPSKGSSRRGSAAQIQGEVPETIEEVQKLPDESDQSKLPGLKAERKQSVQQGVALFSAKTETAGILSTNLNDLSETAQLEYLKNEVIDLSEKLDTLREKRSQDKQKLQDYERAKIQLQQLVEYKNRMSDAHLELQKQLQAAQKDAREAIAAREVHAEEMSGLAETVELASLDKEMAEEKADILQQELEAAKERIQELEMDLEILKAEVQGLDTEVDNENVGVQLKQLQQQNERLREALVKMRDNTSQTTVEQQRMLKEVENLKMHIAEMSRTQERLQDENKKYSEAIVELQEQLRQQLVDAGRRITDYETTILKFRKRTSDLQEEIQDLKDQLLRAEDRRARAQIEGEDDAESQGGFALARDGKLMTQFVENEVRRVDYEATKQQVKYLRAFLPDNFAKAGVHKPLAGDSDSVQLTVILPRLASKCGLLTQICQFRFPAVPGGMRVEHVTKSHKAEQWGFAAKFDYLLNALQCAVRKFSSVLTTCSVERLARAATLAPEIAAQERMLDHYFELARQDKLDENTNLETVEKVINYFQNIYSVHLSSESYDQIQYVADSVLQLLSAARWLRLGLQRVTFYLLPSEGGGDAESLALPTFLSEELPRRCDDIEQYAMRIKNHLPSKEAGLVLRLDERALNNLSESCAGAARVADVLHWACAAAAAQVAMVPDVEGLPAGRMEDMLSVGVERVLGKTHASQQPVDVLTQLVSAVVKNAQRLAEAMNKGEYEVKQEAAEVKAEPCPPIFERAAARKQDAAEAEQLRWQVEKRDENVLELKKQLRARAEQLSEQRVRLELAEKRLADSGKTGDEKHARLQRRLEELSAELRKKERETEQTVETLEQELRQAHKDNDELKAQVRQRSMRALWHGVQQHEIGGAASPGAVLPLQPAGSFTDQQMDSLRSALAFSTSELWRLRGDRMCSSLRALKPLRGVPTAACGPCGLAQNQKKTELAVGGGSDDKLAHLSREVNALQKEFTACMAPCNIVDVSRRIPGQMPATKNLAPANKIREKLTHASSLTNWYKDACTRLAKLEAAYSKVPAAALDKSLIIASITVPCASALDANCGKHVTVRMDYGHIDSIRRMVEVK